MAGKPKRMSQIKQLLRLQKHGHAKKKIARQLGISKNTVKAYLDKYSALSHSIDSLLSMEDPELESLFHAGNPAYKDLRFEYLKERFPYYEKELKRTGVTKFLLWEEYRQDNANSYSRSQFSHHLSQYLKQKNPSMVLHHEAADKLYIDFAGKTLSYVDELTGEIISCQVFVACLPYSDYGFSMAVPSQKVEDFLYALGCCLEDIGGVPQMLVPDNLKSAVVKSNKYEPGINRIMEDFANHYSTTTVPARVRKPKDKALVENHVKLIYSRVYAKLRNQQFRNLEQLNEAIAAKMLEHNQTRMQRKPYCREEFFLSEEKPLLNELPQEAFEIKHYRSYKVAQNNHIYLSEDKHYYSVPYTYIGEQVDVIYTRSLVRIYHKGKQLVTCIRDRRASKYTTDENHLCSTHQHYLNRSPDYYIDKAKAYSDDLRYYIEQLFTQKRPPEQLYRSCDGLLALSRNTDKDTFSKACAIAISYKKYSYGFIMNLLKNKMTEETHITKAKKLPEHENIRGNAYYKNQ